ncbi:hypothetical protein VC596_24540 [Citrobacter freundii]|nr:MULTISPECIES: hypothetical protein [Enterobacteriaceae]MBS6132918.1 hypothetical protein [Enterobacter cloacae]POV57181.1 hypothetical protein C3404_26575 [Citrobacter freundii complex sp. CFNIH11]HDC4373639.1 hypothetical protein [Enterobacter hormaechei]ASK00625.1 hypothetical protein CFA70_10800 [Citrobacter freundii]EKU1546512.1 hypothetical protein [Citrobacter freundii]
MMKFRCSTFFGGIVALSLAGQAIADVESYNCTQVARIKPKSNSDENEINAQTKVLISGSRMIITSPDRETKLLRVGDAGAGRETYTGNDSEIALKVSTPDAVSFVLTAKSGDPDGRLWHFINCTEFHE